MLLVDEHADFARQAQLFLEHNNLVGNVTRATSVAEGLSVAGSRPMDLVVVDFAGETTDAFVRRLKSMPRVPMVLATSPTVSPEYRTRALESGADGFVWKGRFADELSHWLAVLSRPG